MVNAARVDPPRDFRMNNNSRVPVVTFCVCCGARFTEWTGFTEPHKPGCANARHGWAFTMQNFPAPANSHQSGVIGTKTAGPGSSRRATDA